jgi:transposase
MASSGSATWVGIDVSKDWLDVAILPTTHTFRVPNAARG